MPALLKTTQLTLAYTSQGFNMTSSPLPGELEHFRSSLEHTNDFMLWFVLNLILAAFIIAGNGLTIAAVGTTQVLQTQANMYVVSLALADLLAGIYLLLEASWLHPVTGVIFDEFKVLCLMKYAVLYVCLSSSNIMMTCIAIDKLLYVAAPFLHRRAVTEEKTLVICGMCWLLSGLYGSAVWYANTFDPRVGCQNQNVLHPTFVFYGNTTPVALAFLVIAGCYLEIIRIVIKQRRKIRALNQLSDLDRDSYKKSFKLFVVVLGVFVCCWAPYALQGLIRFGSRHLLHYHKAFLLLALTNSGLNFFIYAWNNKDFRRAYKRLLRDRCRVEQCAR